MTIYVQHLGRSSLLLGVSLPCLLLCSPNPDRAVQHSDSRDGLLEVVLDEIGSIIGVSYPLVIIPRP